MSYPPILRKRFGVMVHGLLDMGGWGDLVEVKIERRNAKKKPGLQLKKTGSAAMAECHETLAIVVNLMMMILRKHKKGLNRRSIMSLILPS